MTEVRTLPTRISSAQEAADMILYGDKIPLVMFADTYEMHNILRPHLFRLGNGQIGLEADRTFQYFVEHGGEMTLNTWSSGQRVPNMETVRIGECVRLKVKAMKVYGFLGQSRKQVGGYASITLNSVYDVADGYITDDVGKRVKLEPKPYAARNGIDFYVQDTSYNNETHVDFKIVE